MTLAPIILFVYNRPDHTLKTLEALIKNKFANDSVLYIFSDGPKKELDKAAVERVRSIIDDFQGFKQIHITKQVTNNGLAKSVIQGVTEILKTHDRAIVLEDDIVTTSNFLSFMNNCLDRYKSNDQIFSVTGYTPAITIPENYTLPVFTSYRGSSWGWAIWKDRWEAIDWKIRDKDSFIANRTLQNKFNRGGQDLSNMLKRQLSGKIDSWAIRFAYNAFKQDKYHITPVISKVQNIGHDNSGVHSSKTKRYDVLTDQNSSDIELPTDIPFNWEINNLIYTLFKKPFYKRILITILRKVGVMR